MTKKIIIIGDDFDAWALSNSLTKAAENMPIQLIHILNKGPKNNTYSEALPPKFNKLLTRLHINKADFIQHCKANYHLGYQYQKWSNVEGFSRFFLPFRNEVDQFNYSSFTQNIGIRIQGYDIYAHPDAFFLNAVLAQHKLSPCNPYQFPFSSDYGYYVCKNRVTTYLKENINRLSHDINANITIETSHISSIIYNQNQIEFIEMSNGQKIYADIFIDTTIKGNALSLNTKESFTSISMLPHYDIIEVKIANIQQQSKASINQACKGGWQYAISNKEEHFFGIVFDPKVLNTLEAQSQLMQFSENIVQDINHNDYPMITAEQMQKSHVTPYVSSSPWQGNVINIGKAHCHLPPLASMNDTVNLAAIESLTAILTQNDKDLALSRQTYNHTMQHVIQSALDFQQAHLHFSDKLDKGIAVTQGVDKIKSHWLSGQAITSHQLNKHTVVDELAWNCLLSGLGVFPEKSTLIHVPELEQFTLSEIQEFLTGCASNFSPSSECKTSQGVINESS